MKSFRTISNGASSERVRFVCTLSRLRIRTLALRTCGRVVEHAFVVIRCFCRM